MDTRTIEIDLGKVVSKETVKFLSGKERGIAAREYFGLDDIAEVDCQYIVQIPDFLTGVSSSFTNGLLGGLVVKSGGLEKFLDLAKFDGKLFVVSEILSALERGYNKDSFFE